MEKRKRIYQIDLFRFIAALSVVFYHYLFRGWAADNMSAIEFRGIGEYFKYGYLGVDLFFIISGFVITLSVRDNSLIKFIVSRFIRLYPVYWMSIVFTFVVILLFGGDHYGVSWKQLLINFTMFQGVFKVKNIDGSYWSLLIELKFYILIGSFILINKFKKMSLSFFVWFWLILTVAYVFFRELYVFKIINYLFILNWSSYFIAGIVLYQIYKRKVLKFDIKEILLIFALLLSCYNAVVRLEGLRGHFKTTFSPIIVCIVIAICFLFMYVVAIGKLSRINSSSLLKLGMLTYPLYLIHQYVGFVIFNNMSGLTNKYIILVGTVFFMIFVSYIISSRLEVKMAGFMHKKIDGLIKVNVKKDEN